MFKKKGFTTAEVLITLGIAGVLAMMVLPMTNKLKPNREMMMFKKAYHETNRIVDELVNDDDLYPDDNSSDSGFSNTSEAEYKGKTFSGDSKFCSLFASKLGAKSPQCDEAGFEPQKAGLKFSPNFASPDGMLWGLPAGNGNNSGKLNTDYSYYIAVDVNGDKGENCFEGSSCSKPDRFVIYINRWGKTWVEGDVEKLYLNTTGSTKSYKDLTKN